MDKTVSIRFKTTDEFDFFSSYIRDFKGHKS